uniref:SET domain-containing protein 9-like n=1 Tax=Styela clava TaxID=7725 RepID=UPI00193A6BA0|nr:SET domain-containing protein 9-like [Styela clava]
MKSIIKKWNSYKYRFVPWIKLKNKSLPSARVTNIGSDKIISDAEVLQQVTKAFKNLERSEEKLVKSRGFSLEVRKSTLTGAGRGVFVRRGAVKKGTVVSFYPGTIYLPYESIFFQSIANPFIFKCSDGILIDGNNKGISKLIFKSCAERDRVGPYLTADVTWLNPYKSSLNNIGQIVNNQTSANPANVCYQEFDFPDDFPLELKKFIPHVFYQSLCGRREMRTVVLVTTRHIEKGEELFSSYYTLIKQ